MNKEFIKEHQEDIILFIGVILISLLSFAAGYIVAKQQEKEPIKIEMINEFTNQYEFTNSPKSLIRITDFGYESIYSYIRKGFVHSLML